MATATAPGGATESPAFKPFVPPERTPAEMTFRAVFLGAILGRSTILENNMVQTTGSAGESIAAGVVFTLPAILLMGYDLTVGKVAVIAVAGGVIGILLNDPAPARPHREGARAPHLSRGHRLRGGARGRRTGRASGQAAVSGVRPGLRIQVPDGRAQGMAGIPRLVGVHLPISTSASMFEGGVVRWLVERRSRRAEASLAQVESGPGVLFSSGLIAGGALAGIAIAGIAAVLVTRADAAQVPAADYLAHVVGLEGTLGGFAQNDLVARAMFAGLGFFLYRVASR